MITITFEREGLTHVVREIQAEIYVKCWEDSVDESITHEIMVLA